MAERGVVLVDGGDLTIEEVVAVARGGVRVELGDNAHQRMRHARAYIDEAAAGERPVYGVTTGFGGLASMLIPADARVEMQHAILRSHAAGMGPAIEPEVIRALILLRAATLAKGYSGARPVVAEGLVKLLNAGIVPYIPAFGSLGASGDLAPLAHASLLLIGEGWVVGQHGQPEPAGLALADAGIEPITLEAKEGLALINSTDGMLGMLSMAIVDALRLFRTADLIAAMTVEGLLGTDRPFAADLQALRPHPGQAKSAANLRRMLDGSPLVAAHDDVTHGVQDAYSLRCHPQVIGAARDTLDHVTLVAERELAAAVDNPVILPDGRVESVGNFHGEPLAFACDFLTIAACEVGAISQQRVDRMLDSRRSRGLPPFLSTNAGVNSGLMIAQYTAAALVAENRRLSHPASTDSMSTSAGQEDHVSLGWASARNLRQVLVNLARILAVEAMAAGLAIDLRDPIQPGVGSRAALDLLRQHVPGPGPDRFLAPELATVTELLSDGSLLGAVEGRVGTFE
ncbi:MAG TPA: histidine ammonia-lyase [Thermomicrobiales bacterium]|nr:histidine ammonia-lyase [Thermomicrobiales bacterium]